MVAVYCASPELYWLRVDANSNLTSLTPPGRPAHAFTYDSRDLTTQYAPPAATPGGPTGYTWNADAQPVSTTRPGGDVILRTYDLAGRPQTLAIPRGSFGYGFDGPTGKLSTMTGPSGSSRSYGYQGALLASLGSGGPVSGSASWTYDNNYRTMARTVNGGNGLTFDYDSDDLATAVGSLTLGRNAQNGLLTGTTLGGVTDSLTYSTFAEVSGYTASAGASLLYSESYVREDLGRITQRTEVLQGTTTTWGYVYDLAGRLQSVTRNGAAFESYTYDANDNRLTKTTTAGTTNNVVDSQDRLQSSSGLGGAQAWTYDGNGDLLTVANASGTTVFDYDTSGQLLSVTKPSGQIISYDLDAGNKRAVKRLNGVVQRKWLYAGGLLPVAEYDASDNLVSVFNGGYMVRNGTPYRLLRDHLGSVRLVVDANTGIVAQRLSYGPWGEVLEDTNPGFQPFGYAGGLYDPDTGLVRFGARDYDARIGRWTCKDFAGLGTGPNLYAYAENNPVNATDPTGAEAIITTGSTTFHAYTIDAFVDYVSNLPSGSIDKITIRSHGGTDNFGLNVRDDVENFAYSRTKGDPRVYLRRLSQKAKGHDLKDLLKDKFKDGATIELRACNTAGLGREGDYAGKDDNIAKALSEIFPNVWVEGARGGYEYLPLGPYDIDMGYIERTTYHGGTEVSSVYYGSRAR